MLLNSVAMDASATVVRLNGVAGLSDQQLRRVRGRLVEFSSGMFESMRRSEQRRWGEVYVRGLMLDA